MGEEDAVIIPLKLLLNKYSKEKVKNLLNTFECSKNADVENFLKNSSILFEEINKSRTYLVIKKGTTNILGYFTLTLSILKIVEDVSKNTLKKLDGISKDKTEFPIYLIGQLGKNEVFWNEINGSYLLESAISNIYDAYEVVGGRAVLIETLNNEKLIKFYTENGFKYLQKRLDVKKNINTGEEIKNEYVQLIKFL